MCVYFLGLVYNVLLVCLIRDFMLTIEIKEDPDDPKERARRAAAKRKQKEAEAALANNKSKIPVGDNECLSSQRLYKQNVCIYRQIISQRRISSS